MKKMIAITGLVTSAMLYTMHPINLDETARKHVCILRAAYPTLSPICSTNPTGKVDAYYFFNNDFYRTQVIVAKNDGTYERLSICADQGLEHLDDLNESEYKQFIEGWNMQVKKDSAIKLLLEKNN